MHNSIQDNRSPPWVIYILICILICIMLAVVLLRRTVSDRYYCIEWVLWCNMSVNISLEYEKNRFVQWWIQLFARGRSFSRKHQIYISQTFANKSQEKNFTCVGWSPVAKEFSIFCNQIHRQLAGVASDTRHLIINSKKDILCPSFERIFQQSSTSLNFFL